MTKRTYKKLLIYDFDGVIVDSKEAVFKFYDIICENFNLKKFDKSNKKLVEKILMLTTNDALNLLTDDSEIISNIKSFIRKKNFDELINYMKLQPNLIKVLKTLKNQNIKLSIFTNRGISVYKILTHFNIHIFFDYIVTSNDIKEPKPSPEGLIKILKYFNIQNYNALYIGDSVVDELAAEKASIPFISYKNNTTLNDNIINNHSEIFRYL
ncbi:MAG: HAD-IA family hydrolase [Deferribacterota bacterium]|nr:HAD-IA family hydrolase [Deferribacterota bacterium]